jgi:hypothetical protein
MQAGQLPKFAFLSIANSRTLLHYQKYASSGGRSDELFIGKNMERRCRGLIEAVS